MGMADVMVCPACARRWAGVIADDCPVCAGLGVVNLGAAATHKHGPAPAALAVAYYLEARARDAAGRLAYAEHPAALEAAVAELRAAGVLAAAAGKTRAVNPPTAQKAVAAAVQLTLEWGMKAAPTDAQRLHGKRRPRLAGCRDNKACLPAVSANGHASHLARAADQLPLDAVDVWHVDRQHQAEAWEGRVLAAATPLVARRRATVSAPPTH